MRKVCKKKMFKNFCTDAFGLSGAGSEVSELALSFGFKSLDVDIVDFAAQVKAVGMTKARRFCDSAKLQFSTFRLPVDWHDDPEHLKNDLAALPEYLEIARELGCTRALTGIEPAGDMRPFHENFEYHRRKLLELAAAVEPFGMSLGVEFQAQASYKKDRAFQFIQSADQALLLLKSVHAPNLGLVLDTWHWHLGGGTLDPIRSLDGEQIVAVYLSDCDEGVTAADAVETARRLPGETGVIDCAAILTALAELGYEGPLSPRPCRENLAGQSRDKSVKAASSALDECWKTAGLSSQGKPLAAAT